MLKAIEDEIGTIDLSVGDVIIDNASGDVGLLMERIHRIDMALDDMYFWRIKWTSTAIEINDGYLNNLLEEDYLKMSVFLGIIKWQSTNGGTFEL
tara:strand:+ start:1263 stop:1547 length:285 start_codon:yes stop_codon:yes gene_type:complete